MPTTMMMKMIMISKTTTTATTTMMIMMMMMITMITMKTTTAMMMMMIKMFQNQAYAWLRPAEETESIYISLISILISKLTYLIMFFQIFSNFKFVEINISGLVCGPCVSPICACPPVFLTPSQQKAS
jgi:hypothetical protein